jgi:hypothetical protein
MSVWTAPVSAGAGKSPTITATPTATADVGVAALEYSGLSSAAGTAVVDQTAQATGKTTAAAVVSTPATPATSGPDELVLGFYADSGFGDTLMARMGFNGRVDVSPTEDIELLAEDALTGATGATPSASVQTGASTIWLMATVVFKSAPAAEPPAAPAERREPDHDVHRHAVRRLPAAEAADRLGHESRDRRFAQRHRLPLHGGCTQRARQGADILAHGHGQAVEDIRVGPVVHPAPDGGNARRSAHRLRGDGRRNLVPEWPRDDRFGRRSTAGPWRVIDPGGSRRDVRDNEPTMRHAWGWDG